MRLDIYLVKMGYFASRELAKYNISNGNVLVNEVVAVKPSMQVDESSTIRLSQSNVLPYVSKGGLKLKKALDTFSIDCKGFDVLDVGASTGGFTDCVLQHGARKVYAIDVGTNQLAKSLQDDPRVISIENIHIKDLKVEELDSTLFHLLVTDLSFISLTKVVEYFPKFLLPDGMVIALIKPQFEVGKQLVGRGGIVKNPKAHIVAINQIFAAAQQVGLYPKGLTHSPFVESSRNIEYLALFDRNIGLSPDVAKAVNLAFGEL